MYRKMASNSDEIVKSLKYVLERIQKVVDVRPQALPKINPRLVAVTKTKPITDILTAYSFGQRHFGENYVVELEEKSKSEAIIDQCSDIRWHFIGHLQRNKANKIASREHVGFFNFPKDKSLRKVWSEKLGRRKRKLNSRGLSSSVHHKNLMKAVEDLREHRSSNKIAKEVYNIEEKHKPSLLVQSTPK
ncbi:hypothetical protein ACF0H5_009404 [Mactra antiquata]